MTDRLDLVAMVVAVVATAAIAATPIAGLTTPGRYAVATMAFAPVLWVTGALPLPVTALAIPVLLVGFGVYPDLGDAVAGFADPVIFLLLAGFVLAEAMAAHGIDRRIAYIVLARVGTSPGCLVLAVMIATAGLSMIVSNTAMAALIVPLLFDVGPTYAAQLGGATNASVTLALAGAVAASYGFALPVATPPNAIVFGAGYIRREHMLRAGLPLGVVMIGMATLVISLLVRFVWPAVL